MYWTSRGTNIQNAFRVNYYMRIAFLLFCCSFIFLNLHAQEISHESIMKKQDSLQNPTPQVSKSLVVKEKFKPIPKKALLYSLIIPGGGQFYNRKYWKLPLVYAAYGGIIYAIDYNQKGYDRFRVAYELNVDGDPDTIDEFTEIGWTGSSDQLKRLRDTYRKNLEISYMFTIIIHALSGIEAYVDAHLMDFDVSDDLSFKIKPTFDSNMLGVQAGVGVSFTF